MALPALCGHGEARISAAAALRAGRLGQSLLVHGPAGIGKERFGLWLAQLLVCERPGDEPCGQCGPCRWAERLEHPDIHWFFPLPRPDGASTPERLRAKLEEHRAAELQARRTDRMYVPRWDKPATYFLASIQGLQSVAASRPAAGSRKVFVVGDAEMMVPQESSPEAANAFLKLLEEPPADTVLIITSSRPGALLPTIRSRVLPLRLRPLPTREIEQFLTANGISTDRARTLAALAGGAPGEAMRLATSGDDDATGGARGRARAWLRAAAAPGPGPRLQLAAREAPAGGRGEFSQTLDAYAECLRDLLAAAAGAVSSVPEEVDQEMVRQILEESSPEPASLAAALDRVADARELAAGNVNPQLILAVLLRDTQRAIRGAP